MTIGPEYKPELAESQQDDDVRIVYEQLGLSTPAERAAFAWTSDTPTGLPDETIVSRRVSNTSTPRR